MKAASVCCAVYRHFTKLPQISRAGQLVKAPLPSVSNGGSYRTAIIGLWGISCGYRRYLKAALQWSVTYRPSRLPKTSMTPFIPIKHAGPTYSLVKGISVFDVCHFSAGLFRVSERAAEPTLQEDCVSGPDRSLLLAQVNKHYLFSTVYISSWVFPWRNYSQAE